MTYQNKLINEENKIKFFIPASVKIINQFESLVNDQLIYRINSWAEWLRQRPYTQQGVVVNFEHWTVDILCFYLALMVTETPYYAVSEANFTEHTLNTVASIGFKTFIYQARPYNPYENNRIDLVTRLGLDPVDFALQSYPRPTRLDDVWYLKANSDNFYCFTSGTTGPSKLISHKNRSLLWASTQAAELFYNNQDTVSLSVLPNHIGVMSMGVLSPIIAGSTVNLCFPSNSTFKEMFARGNKCLMFYYGYLKQFREVDLSNFDTVITGGEPIRQAFLDEMFAKGVKRIASVYGLTECLPPIATKWFDRPEVNYGLGKFTTGIDYRIINGQLELSGPNCYLDSGEWKISGDLVEQENNEVRFVTREVNSVRIGDNIVIIDRLRECCEQQGLDDFVIRAEEAEYKTSHEKETILVLYTQQSVNLSELNEKIVKELGELYRIHMYFPHRFVARNDIFKAVMH